MVSRFPENLVDWRWDMIWAFLIFEYIFRNEIAKHYFQKTLARNCDTFES